MEIAEIAAITSNGIAAFALIVAYASYKVSRRTERRLEDASQPTVLAEASPLHGYPHWYRLDIKVINHSRYVLEGGNVQFKWPIGCTALGWEDVTERDGFKEPKLKEVLPFQSRRRKIKTLLKVQPAGVTSGNPIFLGTTDTLNFQVAVYEGLRLPLLRYFFFNVSFVSNLSDIRRFKRHVSKQRIAIPKTQSA